MRVPDRRDVLRWTMALPGWAWASRLGSLAPAAAAGDPVAFTATGEPKSVAAVVTVYRRWSHADVILGKILEGWQQTGGPGPALRLAGLYVDQFPDDDLARTLAAKHGVPIFTTIEQALTLGGDQIGVDAVLSIGEHGDYPFNELGQHLYPRRRFFDAIADAFDKYGRVVPVFNDKHLGPQWQDAWAMYERSRQAGIPLMAGSSLPVGYRLSSIDLPMSSPLEAAVGIGYSGLDIYGIHALEFFQAHVERRPEAERGVAWVEFLSGESIWEAVDAGVISEALLLAALEVVPKPRQVDVRQDASAGVFLFEYVDGFRGAIFMLGCVQGTSLAVQLAGQPRPLATAFDERSQPVYPHFAHLLSAFEQMAHTGQPPYPVERTLLTGGILDAALRSRAAGGVRQMTPHLAIAYQPVDYPHGRDPDRPHFTAEAEVAFRQLSPEFCWFHPRLAVVPGAGTDGRPAVIMTLLKHLAADDHYSGLYVSRSDDLGGSWSEPTAIGSLDWRVRPDGVTEAVVDTTPGWHAPTRRVLVVGARILYTPSGDYSSLLDRPDAMRISYASYDPANDDWSHWQELDLAAAAFEFGRIGSGCSQWLVEPDGSLLIPAHYQVEVGGDYASTVIRARFDGQRLEYLEHGSPLLRAGGRGWVEPSLARFGGDYFLTLRNDDGSYVARSPDGLHYEAPRRWIFDDGRDLGSYNTQTHWLTHSDGLFLVYTRRGAGNDHIPRHRAPLFVAQVDPRSLRVIRRTEQLLIPERGVMLGNFGATEVTAEESWVTDAEFISRLVDPLAGTRPAPGGADGSVWLGRVRWGESNRLLEGGE
jgi:hypothetical protein